METPEVYARGSRWSPSRFDFLLPWHWYNEGTTAAERLASHKLALSQVTKQLENLKDVKERLCK
jgi:hypothetical protein